MIERQMVSIPLNGEQNRITESQKGPRSVKALGAVLLDTVVFLYTKIYILMLTNLFKNTILISITVIVIILKLVSERKDHMNYSRQRESIKDFLSTRKDHPTADTIYMNIRKQFPNISLGTIYRNLNLLSDIGEITRLTTGDGCDHYDFNTAPHNHFVCTRCHSVLDLEMDSIDDIVEVARKNFPGRIDRHCTYFYGICAECMDTSEEAS